MQQKQEYSSLMTKSIDNHFFVNNQTVFDLVIMFAIWVTDVIFIHNIVTLTVSTNEDLEV